MAPLLSKYLYLALDIRPVQTQKRFGKMLQVSHEQGTFSIQAVGLEPGKKGTAVLITSRAKALLPNVFQSPTKYISDSS